MKRDKKNKKHSEQVPLYLFGLVAVAAVLLVFNQVQISALSGVMYGSTSTTNAVLSAGSSGNAAADLSAVKLEPKSTAHTIAAVFPVEQMTSADKAMQVMFPTGTPEYGQDLGVSFDEPVESLATLARMYRGLKEEVKKNDPEAFERYVHLASEPYGVSCEYCCGIGPVGADKNGNSRCGCQHNPAALSVALYLSAYSDYSDAEILREVMRWKTLFFPRNMIDLGAKLGGGDTSVLKDLPGMVGGC